MQLTTNCRKESLENLAVYGSVMPLACISAFTDSCRCRTCMTFVGQCKPNPRSLFIGQHVVRVHGFYGHFHVDDVGQLLFLIMSDASCQNCYCAFIFLLVYCMPTPLLFQTIVKRRSYCTRLYIPVLYQLARSTRGIIAW